MISLGTIVASFFIALAFFMSFLYIFGINADTKRRIEDAAFDAMGESKPAQLVADALHKIPDAQKQHDKMQAAKEHVRENASATTTATDKAAGDVVGHVGAKVDDAKREVTSK